MPKRFEWPGPEDVICGAVAALILNMVILAIAGSWMILFEDFLEKKPTVECAVTDTVCAKPCPQSAKP